MENVLNRPTVTFQEYFFKYASSPAGYNVIFTGENFGAYTLHYDVCIKNTITDTVLEEWSEDVPSYDFTDGSYTVQVPTFKFFDIEAFTLEAKAYVYVFEDLSTLTVSELCESVKTHRFGAVTYLQKDASFMYLKAFCNMPGNTFEPVYMYWEYSSDGVTWKEFDLTTSENIQDIAESVKCSVLNQAYTPEGDLDSTASTYVLRTMWRLLPNSSLDSLDSRPDIVRISTNFKVDNTLYRVKMCTVKEVTRADTEYVDGAYYTEKTNLGMSVYTPVFSQQSEILTSNIFNVSNSSSLYYGSTLYGFGNPEFKNNVIATFPRETVRPMSRSIPLDSSENSYVTALLPWKNYIVAFTEKTIHLISVVEDGFTSTTVNTFVGVPAADAKCCVATLNGIIFKSNSKLYMLYPNMYAGTDNVLNVTEISPPIESYLEGYTPTESNLPFAIGTDSAYILMLPDNGFTTCIRYHYVDRRWTVYKYPISIQSYEMLSVSNIRVFGYTSTYGTKAYGEFALDADYSLIFKNVPDNLPYADCLKVIDSFDSLDEYITNGILQPIRFELDSGQKTDSLNHNKQFVESKFNVVTLHEKDSFPMKITVHVDGCPFVTTRDVNTDSAFWKQDVSQLGTLSTNFTSDASDIFNVFRQMFIRYSGKGKSIRHIIEGESLYPFKIYEIDYRYRNLNVKQ